ncbi:hypothetical protein K3495_g343 [Podosphaera aphanis]|nr:hypothetical protein K3495_g343 [Podosphaera aphanis]
MANLATVSSNVKSDTNSAKSSKVTSSAIPAPSSITAQDSTPSKSENTETQTSPSTHDSPYLRDLYKNIRNVNKKITNASKVDNVVAENPNLTLDELVSTRKINADQKAQILKKPALQASLIQLEEQVAQYKKFDAEFSARFKEERAALEKTLKENSSKELEEAIALVKAQERENTQNNLEQNLLLISQFLKLAAIRRAEEEIAELEESKALEGLLAQVYTGDANAVTAMLNLINGSEATLRSVNGEDLNITYASLRIASQSQISLDEPEPEGAILDQTVSDYPPQNTLNGSNSELSESKTTSSDVVLNDQSAPYENPILDTQAINTTAEPSIDAKHESNSREWDVAPRKNQTVNDVASKYAASSWADDHIENPAEVASKPPVVSDGFQEIQRNRGGRGYHRGGRGEGHRGRYRGEGYRGRGRGGGHRGGRRSDD